MAISIVFALLCLLAARAILRDWQWSAIIASAVVLFTFRIPVVAFALLGFGFWWVAIGLIRRRSGKPAPSRSIALFAARAIGIFGFVWAALMGSAAISAIASVPDFEVPRYTGAASGGPNIYILMLDGYPRGDTLRETFNIDISEFEAELDARGFDIAHSAQANYNKTWPALGGFLNGTYIHELMPQTQVPSDPANQLRWLHALIQDGAFLDSLREGGYITRAIPGPFLSTALTTVDDFRTGGHLNEFEVYLIAASPWTHFFRDEVTEMLRENQRRLITFALSEAAWLAEHAGERPQFVFAHVHAPHTPFVLPDDLQDPESPSCFPTSCSLWNVTTEELSIDFSEYREGFALQLHELNRMVLDSVRRITEVDPGAVVLVMSDHGARYSEVELDEHYRIFLAARTPGFPQLFDDGESMTNLLRVLLQSYLGLETPRLPYESWLSDWRSYLPLRPVDLEQGVR